MTNTRTCTECKAPLPADRPAHLCPEHAENLLDTLTQLPALVDDVNLTITRQTATGARNGPRSSSDTVMAFDDRASKTLATALARLITWAKSTVPDLEREQARYRTWLDGPAYYVFHPTATAVADRRHTWITEQINYVTGARWTITANHRRIVDILIDQLDHLLARVEALHQPHTTTGGLTYCTAFRCCDPSGIPSEWPCDTRRAITGEEPSS